MVVGRVGAVCRQGDGDELIDWRAQEGVQPERGVVSQSHPVEVLDDERATTRPDRQLLAQTPLGALPSTQFDGTTDQLPLARLVQPRIEVDPNPCREPGQEASGGNAGIQIVVRIIYRLFHRIKNALEDQEEAREELITLKEPRQVFQQAA